MHKFLTGHFFIYILVKNLIAFISSTFLKCAVSEYIIYGYLKKNASQRQNKKFLWKPDAFSSIFNFNFWYSRGHARGH